MLNSQQARTLRARSKRIKEGRSWKDLTPDEHREFYKMLPTHSFVEAMYVLGMNKYYKDETLRSIGYKLYKELDPVALGIGEDLIQVVKDAVNARKVGSGTRKITETVQKYEEDPVELIDPNDTKAIVIGGRNKAAMLLHKKMDILNKNKKALDQENIGTLAKVFGILFDKSQIVLGQATENIAVMAKIDDNMSPEDSLQAILKMREVND